LGSLPVKGRVIVVDDQSPDGTADLVRSSFSDKPEVQLIVRTGPRGLATAIARGIAAAEAEVVAIMDTDFNHHPRYLPGLLKDLEDSDLVIGSRYISGGGMKTSKLRYLGSWAFNLFIRAVLATPVKDNLSGFLVLKREVLARLKDKPIFYGYGDYSIRLIHYARKAGFKIREVPVVYEFRLGGESKTDFSKYLISYSKAVLALRFGKSNKKLS
jgi:dolichol-phosphate mannosyltransferase